MGHPIKRGNSQRPESAFGSLQSVTTSETLKGPLSPLDRSRVSVIIEQSIAASSQQNSSQKGFCNQHKGETLEISSKVT